MQVGVHQEDTVPMDCITKKNEEIDQANGWRRRCPRWLDSKNCVIIINSIS